MSAKALPVQSSPIAKAQHVFSFDRFAAGGTQNVKVQMYYFGLLLSKATYRKLPDYRPIYLKQQQDFIWF